MEKTIASITKPKDEELKERLSAAREKLATLQIKVKRSFRYWFCSRIWGCRKGQCVKQDH